MMPPGPTGGSPMSSDLTLEATWEVGSEGEAASRGSPGGRSPSAPDPVDLALLICELSAGHMYTCE